MAVEIKFNPILLKNSRLLNQTTSFAYSPLNELFASLHVLQNHFHHGMLISWKLDAISKLTPFLISEMNYFKLFYELNVPAFLTPGIFQQVNDIRKEMILLKSNFNEKSAIQLVNDFIMNQKIKRQEYFPLEPNEEWINFDQSERLFLKDLHLDPQRTLKRFFKFIDQYNQIIFEEIWRQSDIEILLKNEINNQQKDLFQLPFPQMIHKLENDKIIWTGKKIMLYQPFNIKYDINIQNKIIFVPSYFIWPHLSFQKHNDCIIITYDINKRTIQQAQSIKMEVVLQAVGNKTRIQILNILHQIENTTQGLSQILNLSESSVSRDLNILKDAGLVTSRRVNKYVLYSVTDTITTIIPSFFDNLTDEYID